MAACAIGDEVLSAVPSFNTKKMRLSATRLENGAGELLERGGIDLELGLRDLDQHFIVLAAGELALVLSPLARTATVVEDGDLRARNRSEHGCGGVRGGGRVRWAQVHAALPSAFPCGAARNTMHICMRRADAWFPTAVTHHGRVVLGRHIARPNLLRGGLLHTQAGLRVGRSYGAKDRSTSACIVPDTTDRALSDTTA